MLTERRGGVPHRDTRTVRASRAKSTGGLASALDVLPEPLAAVVQGLFAKAGSHPVPVRLAQGPGWQRGRTDPLQSVPRRPTLGAVQQEHDHGEGRTEIQP